jgi:hypothetical protein
MKSLQDKKTIFAINSFLAMQAINYIQAFFPDYPAISSSTILPTPALRLQKSSYTTSIAVSPLADENLGSEVEFFMAGIPGGKG